MPTVAETKKKQQTHKEPRNARLGIRLQPSCKDVIEQAAALTGVNTSDFVVHAAVTAARQHILVDAAVKMTLNREESIRVAELLMNPPEPNAALRRLMMSEDD